MLSDKAVRFGDVTVETDGGQHVIDVRVYVREGLSGLDERLLPPCGE